VYYYTIFNMNTLSIEKQAEKEFRRYARKNLPNPRKIKRLEQTQYLICELHHLMNDFMIRFDHIPEEAHLLFYAYKNIQDRMVYDNFKHSYRQVLC